MNHFYYSSELIEKAHEFKKLFDDIDQLWADDIRECIEDNELKRMYLMYAQRYSELMQLKNIMEEITSDIENYIISDSEFFMENIAEFKEQWGNGEKNN